MLIQSWLTEFHGRRFLGIGTRRFSRRMSKRHPRRAHSRSSEAALVEVLEPRVLLSGVVLRSETLVNTTVSADQSFAYLTDHSFAMTSDGSGLVAWASTGITGNGQSGQAIMARRLDAQGIPLGGEFQVSAGISPSTTNAVVGSSGTDRYAVVWEAVGNSLDKTGAGIFARLYSTNGTALGNEFRVNQTTINDQNDPSIAWLAPDRFVVTWSGAGVGQSSAVYARMFHSSGTPLTNEIRVPSSSTGVQRDAVAAALPDGGFVVAWSRGGNTDSPGVFARRIDSAGRAVSNEFLGLVHVG